jgi:hypothetical protein
MDLARLVGMVAAAGSAVETTELEWKREWDFGSRPRRADLARHIIGFANRDPDRAAKLFDGHAFLFIGVEPGGYGQAPRLDPADISQSLSGYTGSDVFWHPVYVTSDQHEVLVIVVDPPRWGDPIRSLERGSLDPTSGRELRAGTVFVRRPGTTVAADGTDLARLRARAESPTPRLAVALDWNLGRRGDYVGVKVSNGPTGASATIREVGFTQGGAFSLDALDDHGAPAQPPRSALAYGALPISEVPTPIAPAEHRLFRIPMGRLPFCWDESTQVFPYLYYDEGHWLVGKSSPLAWHLAHNGWRDDPQAPPMFTELVLDLVWPPEEAGMRSRFDLTAQAPFDRS